VNEHRNESEVHADADLGRLELHRRAIDGFSRRVHQIRPDQWRSPTPCTDWDVRDLVQHLVVEQLWVPPLVDGRTVPEIGDRFDGDQVGADPVAAWDRAADAAVESFGVPGVLRRTVHLSYGDVPASGYCWDMTIDATIHTWDLARGIGAEETLDPELVDLALDSLEQHVDELQASGLFAPPVPVGADAPAQTRLLALLGRRV
jgi:uncharacterized protein (TIGR03086 family)